MTPTEKSRSASRFLAGLPTSIDSEDGAHCEAYNLSRTGVLLVGELAAPDTEHVQITIRSPQGDLEFAVRAVVRRTDHDEKTGITELGVEFEEVEEAHRPTLEALVARVVEGVTPAPLAALPLNPKPVQIRDALDKVSIAHRMSLAHRGLPQMREILLHDPNPRVLDALAKNPSVRASEVQALLRMPALLPQTIEHLSRDARWTSNPPMKLSIAGHRSASFAVADRLIASMPPEMQQKILQMPGLNPGIRTKLSKKFSKGPTRH